MIHTQNNRSSPSPPPIPSVNSDQIEFTSILVLLHTRMLLPFVPSSLFHNTLRFINIPILILSWDLAKDGNSFQNRLKKESGGPDRNAAILSRLWKSVFSNGAKFEHDISCKRYIALLTFYHYHFIIIIELVPHKSRFPKMFGSRPKWFCRFSFPPRFRIQFLLAVCLFRRSLIYRVFRSKSIRKGEGKSKRILFKASRYYPPLLSCKITSRL